MDFSYIMSRQRFVFIFDYKSKYAMVGDLVKVIVDYDSSTATIWKSLLNSNKMNNYDI